MTSVNTANHDDGPGRVFEATGVVSAAQKAGCRYPSVAYSPAALEILVNDQNSAGHQCRRTA